MDILRRVEIELRASGARVFEIGKSVCGLPLLAAHKGGTRGRQLIITAAIHARECYTALAVTRQAAEYKGRGDDGVYFVPLVNPDGALFFETGETFGRAFLERNAARRAEWKANAEGVDLNTNFDANFGGGRQNKLVPGASDFIGAYPLCAPETAALALLTSAVKPISTVSYHCMGGELYWEFSQSGKARERDEKTAAAVAAHIGVKKVDGHLFSAGGYKDYCIEKYGIPSFTIELIKSGSHPFPPEAYSDDIAANADLPEFLLDILTDK